ncbi:hemicentin-1-like [Centruroides sculpturatus]|uniref:hemicentin-1-like n=1 Tax=Centruroides sculpturatus TaxID=218467 RepID=UPI000C6CDB6C|nr:hemicentin-1-like [Centruroides sculpturatus]
MENNYWKLPLQFFLTKWFIILVYCSKDEPRIQPFSFPNEVILGQKASVACTAVAGSPPLEFVWQKNGREINPSSKVIIRSLGEVSVIILEAVSVSDVGNYTCLLKNVIGTDSYTASLFVKAPAKWINDLSDVELVIGMNRSIECQASGLPLPVVTWKKVIASGKGSESSIIVEHQRASEGRSQLLIDKADYKNVGYYVCEASNGVGDKLSRSIALFVRALAILYCRADLQKDDLKIQPFNFPSPVIIGQRVTTTCSTTWGEKLLFSWYKNKEEIENKGHIQIRSYGDLSNIVIDPVSENDDGNYTCVVMSEGLTDAYSTSLNILVPPKWIHKPQDAKFVINEQAILPCQASGKPSPAISWMKSC